MNTDYTFTLPTAKLITEWITICFTYMCCTKRVNLGECILSGNNLCNGHSVLLHTNSVNQVCTNNRPKLEQQQRPQAYITSTAPLSLTGSHNCSVVYIQF